MGNLYFLRCILLIGVGVHILLRAGNQGQGNLFRAIHCRYADIVLVLDSRRHGLGLW